MGAVNQQIDSFVFVRAVSRHVAPVFQYTQNQIQFLFAFNSNANYDSRKVAGVFLTLVSMFQIIEFI